MSWNKPAFLILCAIILTAVGMPRAHAGEPATLSGKPMIVDSGTLMLGGITVKLWGIAPLAPDQQCWRGDVAWPCGEQATDALRHYVEDFTIACALKPVERDTYGQCARTAHGATQDLAGYMVEYGYAMDDPYTSEGLYTDAEEAAQTARRGIWSGRFQTAEDWKNGIQRYVGDDDEAEEDVNKNPAVEDDTPAQPDGDASDQGENAE